VPRLQADDLTTVAGGPFALRLGAGETVCLSGPSGAGKTLLLRALADLDPNEGRVFLDGRAREKFRPAQWRRKVGFLPAESHWWADRMADHFSWPPAYLEQLGLDRDILDRSVERCSTGERQRLALLRLLANEPLVLLLDEPTASLDADNVARAETVIADYRQRHGTAILWVSHDSGQIDRVADRTLRIEGGTLREVRR